MMMLVNTLYSHMCNDADANGKWSGNGNDDDDDDETDDDDESDDDGG